jgi:adenylate cyclase
MAQRQRHETAGGETGALRDRLVRAAEIEAERTLSLIRIAVALTLAAVLIAAIGSLPDLPPATVRRQILIALGVLAVYGLIGLVSLRLACEQRFRTWHPWAFTAADCALVVFNLWSTAVNLELAGWTLWVFPATWLIPLVLVFGALRYRPALQGATVVVLGVGLVSLFAVSAPLDAQLERIGSLLELPPTIVRIVMLGLTGLVLVLAAVRRRQLLDRSIQEATERANLARYLPPEIAALLASGDTARLRQGWQRPIGLLIVDIRGFTGHAERLDPPAITALLEAFRGLVIDSARAHGGIVDKFVGDNAIIVMGVPDARPDDAARTLACGRDLLRRVAALSDGPSAPPLDGEPLRIGIGAHFGEAFVGAVGTAERLEFTVLGDTVNVASRLEQLTRQTDGGLVASADLLTAAGEAAVPGKADGQWRMLDEHLLRGRQTPIDVYLWAEAAV